MTKTYTQALEDFECAVRYNCQCCATDAAATTDAQVDEANQKVLDTAQEDVDAAVAAVVEETAGVCEQGAERLLPITDDIILGAHYALSKVAQRIRALIPTNALAERDAKVRADALREAAAKGAETLMWAHEEILSLIEGEA